MNRQPDMYLVKDIKAWDTTRETKKGKWVPARPYGHNAFGFTWRFKLAWDVLTGKADALFWDEKDEFE